MLATEANDEMRGGGRRAGLPVPGPLDAMVGKGGTGIDATAEGFVHIHRGVIGDSDVNGGKSDLDAGRHRWLNPVARHSHREIRRVIMRNLID